MRRFVLPTFAGVVLSSMISWATGCTNLQDVVRAKDDGVGSAQIYPISEQQAWRITNAILNLKQSNPPPRESRGNGYVLQTIQVSSLSPSVFLGVWIEPAGSHRTKVTFVRKRRGATETVRALTDREFHHDFAALMALAEESCSAERPPSRESPSVSASSVASADGGTATGPDAAPVNLAVPPSPPTTAAPLPPLPSSSGTSSPGAASASSAAAPRAVVSSPAAPSSLPSSSAPPAPYVREIPLPPFRMH